MMDVVAHVADLLMKLHDIDVSRYDDSFIYKSLQKRIAETHYNSEEEYYSFLEHDSREGKIFFDSLRINHSEFFRNNLTFAVLERILLPDMVLRKKERMHKELRIWSAACAGGQEAYSLAILLEELKNGDRNKFNYRIFATDYDDLQVKRGIKGQYSLASLTNLNLKRVNQCFVKHAETYTMNTEFKKNIVFSVFDLFSENLSCPPESIFGDFDLLFCANLLFYYKDKYRKMILEKAGKCLAEGGFIVTGEAERGILMDYGFSEVFPQSAVFRKEIC